MAGFEAFLINPPKGRGTKRKGAKKMARTIRRKRSRSASNPRRRKTARRRTYRRNPGMSELMLLNPPRKRGRRRGRKTSYRTRVRRFGKRAASVGRKFSVSSIVPMLKEGAMLGIGAIVVNNLYSRFVPDSLKTNNYTSFAARAGVSIVGGMLLSRFAGSKLGNAFAVGGIAYSVMILANQTAPQYAPLGALEEYYAAMGSYYAPAVGPSAVNAQPDGLNWEANVPERLSPSNRF